MRSHILSVVIAVGVIVLPARANDWATCNDYKSSQKAIQACTQLIQAGVYRPMAHVYCARGVAYRWQRNYDQAISDFDMAIALDPKDSISYGQRGMAHKLKGDRAQALADLQTAVVLDGSNDAALKELKALRGR